MAIAVMGPAKPLLQPMTVEVIAKITPKTQKPAGLIPNAIVICEKLRIVVIDDLQQRITIGLALLSV
jgi:hypothetical protein